MNVLEVDERDSTWEDHDPVFRVYLARGNQRAIKTVDISGATFSEVLAWSRSESTVDMAFAIALVGHDLRGLKGLTWLFGMDPNDVPENDLQLRMRAEMLAHSTVSGDASPSRGWHH